MKELYLAGSVCALLAAPLTNTAPQIVEQWTPAQYATIATETPTAVMFTADWCIPCKELHPVYAELSARYPQLRFGEVDYGEKGDKDPIIQAMGIDRIPEVRFQVHGRTDRRLGIEETRDEDREDLAQRIENLLER